MDGICQRHGLFLRPETSTTAAERSMARTLSIESARNRELERGIAGGFLDHV